MRFVLVFLCQSMRLNIIDSETTIRAICSPVYGEITNLQRRHQVFFPEQRNMFIKLMYKSGSWKLYHANQVMNKGRIKKEIMDLDKSISLDINSIYFGLLSNDKINWVFIIRNSNIRSYPNYPNYYNSMTRVLTRANQSGMTEYELRSPDNLIILDNNRYSIVNSPLFVDYFLWILFQLPGVVPGSLYQKFSDHVESRGCAQFLKPYKSDALNLTLLMTRIRRALCHEIVNSLTHVRHFMHNGPLYSIFVIYKRYRNLDCEKIEEIMLKANNQYRCDVIRYLKQRSSILQDQQSFDLDDPHLLLAELILRD